MKAFLIACLLVLCCAAEASATNGFFARQFFFGNGGGYGNNNFNRFNGPQRRRAPQRVFLGVDRNGNAIFVYR